MYKRNRFLILSDWAEWEGTKVRSPVPQPLEIALFANGNRRMHAADESVSDSALPHLCHGTADAPVADRVYSFVQQTSERHDRRCRPRPEILAVIGLVAHDMPERWLFASRSIRPS